MRDRPKLLLPATAALAMLLLAACDDRNAGEPDPRLPQENGPSAPSPAATDSPTASIIRPEIVEQAAVEVPPEPLEVTIPFPEGGHELAPRAERMLAAALETEQFAEGWSIVLRGHSNSTGADSSNLRASEQRARAVADWLVEHGVDEERIEVVALGEQRPVAPNAKLDGTPDEEGRARNRRVDLWVAPPAAQPGEGPEQEGDDDAPAEAPARGA